MKKVMKEICNECGKPVKFGSGRFVNRISDFNTQAYRKSMGKPYPEGDFICEECYLRYDEEILKSRSTGKHG